MSNVSLANFAQKFSPVEMYGKTLNISGEVPSSALPGRALDVFKCVTGGDRIDLERKGSQPFCGIITTKLLFAGNTLPTFVTVPCRRITRNTDCYERDHRADSVR